jgi:MFS family permease
MTAFIVGAGMVPAAFGPIAADYKVTKQQASYLTTSYTLLGGLTPLLLTPYVNMYGRRPAYLVCGLVHDTALNNARSVSSRYSPSSLLVLMSVRVMPRRMPDRLCRDALSEWAPVLR